MVTYKFFPLIVGPARLLPEITPEEGVIICEAILGIFEVGENMILSSLFGTYRVLYPARNSLRKPTPQAPRLASMSANSGTPEHPAFLSIFFL